MNSYELRDRRPSSTPASRATDGGPSTYELGDGAPDYKGPTTTISDVKDAHGPSGGVNDHDAASVEPVRGQVGEMNELKRGLHGRHMQMIAIGECAHCACICILHSKTNTAQAAQSAQVSSSAPAGRSTPAAPPLSSSALSSSAS